MSFLYLEIARYLLTLNLSKSGNGLEFKIDKWQIKKSDGMVIVNKLMIVRDIPSLRV